METLASFALAMLGALVCAFGLGWYLANTGGMWRKKYEIVNGKEVGTASPHKALAWAGTLAIISDVIYLGRIFRN